MQGTGWRGMLGRTPMTFTAVATIAVAALLFALTTVAANLVEAAFPRLGRGFFTGLRLLVGVGLLVGAALIFWQRAPVTELQCEVIDTHLDFDQLDRGGQPLQVSLRWRSPDDGEWYRSRKPLGIPLELSRSELVEQYRVGGVIDCYYHHANPEGIHTGWYREGLSNRRLTMLCMLAYGLFFAIMGLRRRHRMARGKSPLPWRGNVSNALLYSLATLALLGVLMSGDGASKFVGLALVVLAGGGFLYFAGRESAAQERAMSRVRRQLRDSKPWPLEQAAAHLSEYDEHEFDGVVGRWRGSPVRVAVTGHAILIQIDIPEWPRRLRIARRDPDSAPANATGDESFDANLRIDAEPLIWRPRLSRTIRRALSTCVVELHGVIESENKLLSFRVGPGELARIEYYLDTGVALAQELAAHHSDNDRRQWLFDHVPDEPNPAVRLGHYQWLHSQGWNQALLARTAARDRDERIRQWAESHLPPSDGVFR